MDTKLSEEEFVAKLYWHPDVSGALVLEDEPGTYWVVPLPLVSNERQPFTGDTSLLESIAAIGEERPGQLGVDVVGVAEIAHRAGVSADTVHKWRARHQDFPAPIATLSAGPVWSWEAVERWLRIARPPGRPSVDDLAVRAWDAVEAALPQGWQAHLIASLDSTVTAEAAGPKTADRLRCVSSNAADALFALAASLRSLVQPVQPSQAAVRRRVKSS